jgi:CRP-like cAMP-binding protein
VKTQTDTKLLVLGKQTFEQITARYPQIPMNICRVFSQRIRTLQKDLID